MDSFNYEEIWQETWGDMQKYGPVHRHHRRIFANLFNTIPRNEIQTIADIGCGEGSNLAFLKSEFPQARLFGFDVSQTAMDAARRRVEAEFILLDIQKQIPPQKFDLVCCSDVIEHLEEDLTALQNIRHITNRVALIATVQGRMRANEDSIGHVRNYAYGELEQKIKSAGFEVLQIVEWGYPFYSPLFRDLVGFSKTSEEFSYGRYNLFKKLIAQVLYVVFYLNSSTRGDVIFILARP